MKYLKIVSGSLLLYFLFFSTGTQLSSCQKETIYDTIIIKDTVTIRDTVDCNCYDLKDGLVAWYNFKGGTLNDSSGKNNHIVFNNATKTTDRFGNANGAYLFNGTSSYMRVANSSSLNPSQAITLAAVVKVNGFYQGLCKGNQIVGKQIYGDYEDGYYALRFSDYTDCYTPIDVNKEFFSGAYGNNYGTTGTSASSDTNIIKTGRWYSVVYTYENGVSKLYIDGALKSERNDPATFTANNADLYIGKAGTHPLYPYWLNGIVDDVRIYDRALCYGEVKQLNRVKD